MSVRVRQRLPTIGDVVQRTEGARLRTLRSEFNSLHPLQFSSSRGLTHDDASVLTKKSGLDSRREFQLSEGSATLRCCALAKSSRVYGAHFSLTQWAGGVKDEHGAVRRRRSEFDSRPACHFLLLTVLENNGRVLIEFSNDTQAPLRLLYFASR